MPATLRLVDFHDFELLHAYRDVADDEGLASASEIAAAIGIDSERPAQNVGSRFAAMKRMGLMETAATSPQGETLWRITDVGEVIFFGDGLTEGMENRRPILTRPNWSASRRGARGRPRRPPVVGQPIRADLARRGPAPEPQRPPLRVSGQHDRLAPLRSESPASAPRTE